MARIINKYENNPEDMKKVIETNNESSHDFAEPVANTEKQIRKQENGYPTG